MSPEAACGQRQLYPSGPLAHFTGNRDTLNEALTGKLCATSSCGCHSHGKRKPKVDLRAFLVRRAEASRTTTNTVAGLSEGRHGGRIHRTSGSVSSPLAIGVSGMIGATVCRSTLGTS